MSGQRGPRGIAGYRFEKTLGKGGMGAVYQSTHPRTGAPVAIKVILRNLQGDEGIQERFRREIRAMTMVEHPNLVRVLDAGEEEGQAYYVMDMVDGVDLATHLHRSGALSLGSLETVATGLFSALAALHDAGIIHRDLKPQNIMMDKSGAPLIMDFGLTRVSDMTALTKTGALLGSPRYLAPEIFRGLKLDGRADLYQAGLILWECAAGEVGFQGDAFQEVSIKIMNGEIPPIQTKRPDLPTTLSDAIEGCLETDLELRLQTGHQVLEVLEGRASLSELQAIIEADRLPEEPAHVPSVAPLEQVAGPPVPVAPVSLSTIFWTRVLPGLAFMICLILGFYSPDRGKQSGPEGVEFLVGLDRVEASWHGAEQTPVQLVVKDESGTLWSNPKDGPHLIQEEVEGRRHLVIEDLPRGKPLRSFLIFPGGQTLPRTLETPAALFRKNSPQLVTLDSGLPGLRADLLLPVQLDLEYPVRGGGTAVLHSPPQKNHSLALKDLNLSQPGATLILRTRDQTGGTLRTILKVLSLLDDAAQRLIKGQQVATHLDIPTQLKSPNFGQDLALRSYKQSRLHTLVKQFQPFARDFFTSSEISRPRRLAVLRAIEELRFLEAAFRSRAIKVSPSPGVLLQGRYFRGDRGKWISVPQKRQRNHLVSSVRKKFMAETDTLEMALTLPPLPSPPPPSLRIILEAEISRDADICLKIDFNSGPGLWEFRDPAAKIQGGHFRFMREIDTRDLPASGGIAHLTLQGIFFPPTSTRTIYQLTSQVPKS
jgi:serine/threonine protein kinase